MTQLELPTISFARYLDLLKRRTWSVVLISIVGLAVGGLVAMLIPRYYVAFTVVQFNRPVLDSSLGKPEDPMSQIIESAKVTVGASVEKAVLNLGWPEARSADLEKQRAFIDGTRQQVRTFDDGPHNKNRHLARLRINYQDTNGRRAMELANEVRDVWLRDFVDKLKTKATRELQHIQDAVGTVARDKKYLQTEKSVFEERHQINPEDHTGDRDGKLSLVTQNLQNAKSQLNEINRQISRIKAELDYQKTQVEREPKTKVLVGADRFEDPAERAAWVETRTQILAIKAQLNGLKANHPQYSLYEIMLVAAQEKMSQMEELAGGGSIEKPNPRYDLLHSDLRRKEGELALLIKDRELVLAQIQRYGEQVAKLPQIYAEYNELVSRLETVQKDLDKLDSERRAKESVMRRINTEQGYNILQQAFEPPAPTVPNRTLVTLLGCLIGLGAAVGVIISLDLLQSTYKTIPEVERGLRLPVLGSLSHMDTAEERDAVRVRRLRLTIAAAIFIALMVAVVTIFYVRPASLPEWVREVLELVLGARK